MLKERNDILRLGLASFICLGNFLARPLTASETSLPLSNGWNLVSLPLQPTDTNILSVLTPIQGSYQSVWTYADGRWYGFNPSVPGLNDLKSMEAGKAYWVQMRNDAVLTVSGLASVNAPNSHAGQKLRPGWNLLGNSTGLSEAVTDAFAPMSGQLDLAAAPSSEGWLWYQPDNPAGSTLGNLAPFRGLWTHVKSSSTWIAPNYVGSLADSETGEPIAGATVSLDGIEAEALTDARGSFIIAGISDAASQVLTAVAPGYAPLATTVDLTTHHSPERASSSDVSASGDSPSIPMNPLPAPFVAEVLAPQNNSVWLQSGACANSGITVKGYTSLNNQSNFLYDIVFVIDTSASTSKKTGFDLNGDGREDTVFEAEVEACRRLAHTFTDTNHTRFGLVKFARYHAKNAPDGSSSDGAPIPAQTRIVQPLTTDLASLQAALDTVVSEGAIGGTHTAAGIDLAVQALTNAPPVGNDYQVTPVRHIVLLTDGIPTLPVESGFTQERLDRVATLEAAQRAAAANISIHPVVIDPTSAFERKLTTMPAVQAITGVPGELIRINANNIQHLPDLIAGMALTSVPAVTVLDRTSGAEWNISVRPNGWFEAWLPASVGTNIWEFRFSSGSLSSGQTISRTVTFVVYPNGTVLDVVSLTSSNQPVRELTSLERPTGGKLYDKGPELSLLAVLKNKAPEAQVIPGVESFRTLSGTMTLEFIFKGAGYNSDVGYFLFDPANPPKTAAEVIAGLAQTNVFLNSGIVPNNKLNVTGLTNTITASPGVAVGLFMIPNGRLSDAKAGRGNAPLFTLASLNPGQFDQAVTFYDPVGRQIICAFEDINIVGGKSDQDFQDLVFTVKPIDPMPQITECP
jgi:hypothetical protein